MRSRLFLAFAAPLLLLAACGLPLDDRATRYDADDLPDEIANTTTSSTTTTTTTTSTTVPSAEQTSDPLPENTTTTTQAPTLATPVDLFYTIGFSDDLARLPRSLFPADVTLPQVLAQLEQPLSDVSRDFGLRTALGRDIIDGVIVDRGVATITLDQDEVDRLTDPALRRAIAQMVLTVTSFRLDNGSGIGKVRFEIDGDGIPVYVPAFGGNSEDGEELSFEDFASMIATTPTPTTTTTSPTTTTTSPPAPESTDGPESTDTTAGTGGPDDTTP